VKILHSDLSARIAWGALTLRDFEAHGIDPTRHLAYLFQFSTEQFATGQAGRHPEWYAGFAALGFPGTRTDLSDTDPVNDIIAGVCELKPDYLRVQPVALELMCAHDTGRELPKIGLSGAICVGEYFEDGAKEDIERYLGCRIMEVYGSNECGRMATTCTECGRYHVHAETIVIDVVDDDGTPTNAGDTGWVLATPLYNYAMPLIRYEHVDEAKVGLSDRCSITLPALDAIYGKRRTPFVFPDGTAIRPTLPLKMAVRYLGAESFQFAQVAPDRCEIRFVAGKIDPAEIQFDQMTQYLRSIWWPGLNIDYQIVDALPRKTRHSKAVQFVRET
jgi:phenylacetate-coenzyme A ligase PaaK-like adenylate-forming protein